MTFPGTDVTRSKAAFIRLVRILVAAALAALATWLLGPGPGDLFGTDVAIYVVPVLTALVAAADKWIRFQDNPPVT